MIPINPGNILPFYITNSATGKQRWHRHRTPGQDTIPFGLKAPRNTLLPFQVWIDGGDVDTDTITWELRSPVNDSTNVVLDETTLTLTGKADSSGYWITWLATVSLDNVPDCGFWFVRIYVEGVYYDSEVMELTDICGQDDAKLEIVPDSCSVDGSDLIFSFQASVYSRPGYAYSLQKYLLGYSEISDQELYEITLVEGSESELIRIQVETVCGAVLTVSYTLTWTSGDACNTLSLAPDSSSIVNGLSVGQHPTYYLQMSNTTDKGNVLYQIGYQQVLYLNPIWDTPEVTREETTEVNGNGDITRRFTRTVDRKRFEFADMPDYALGFLSKVGDLDTVYLSEIETGDALTMTNVRFESRRQGALLNIGVITFDGETEAFSGCQEDFELAG